MNEKKVTSLYLPVSQLDDVSAIVECKERSVSWLYSKAMDEYLSNSHKPVPTKTGIATTPKKSAAKEPVLPDFLDKALWDDFLKHRKKLKAPNTERSLNSLLKKLSGFYNDGHDINEIIQKSYDNGWKDVFEPKGGLNGGNNSKPHRTSIEQDLQFDDWG